MTERELSDTKNKIIEVARVLFAELGFEGTSVREIAKAASVNVASVNYHFSTKEKLFSEILEAGHQACERDISLMACEPGVKLDALLVNIFKYFSTKSHDLLSYFKMMMSSQHNHHLSEQEQGDDFFGPPGGKAVAEAILQEVGKPIADEDLHWALRTLFSNVVHTSIMYHCCFKNGSIPFTTDQDIEKSIIRLSRVVIKELKA